MAGTVVDVKTAADRAAADFESLLKASDLRLEEVELSDDERYWNVTLSGLVPTRKDAPAGLEASPGVHDSALSSLFRPDYERVYRIFVVNATNGDVKSMKIRKL